LWLLVGHALGDYVLQNDFIARAKNHTDDLGKHMYKAVLPSHAGIHAGFVLLVTGSSLLAIFEFITHSWIDFLKCDKRITFYKDQCLHVLSKAVIVVLFFLFY